MPNFRELPVIALLNAPTRQAANQRRKLRKLGAAMLVMLGVWLALGSTQPASSAKAATVAGPHDHDVPDAVKGRVTVSIPVSAGGDPQVEVGARVDLWESSGVVLARDAVVLKSHDTDAGNTQFGPPQTDRSVSVAVTESEFRAIARVLAKSDGVSESRILVTQRLK